LVSEAAGQLECRDEAAGEWAREYARGALFLS